MSNYNQLLANIHDRLGEIAAAVREHTEHIRMDEKSESVDVKSKEIYDNSINTMRRYQLGDNDSRWRLGLPDYKSLEEPLAISEEVVQLMRITPHQFVEPVRYSNQPRIRYSNQPRTPLNKRVCRVCVLPFKNPVHLIQMASLQED